VSSHSPKSELLPLFIGKDYISGTVELDLAKPETVREVEVTVRFSYMDLPPTSFRARKLRKTFLSLHPDVVGVDESNWVVVYPLPPKNSREENSVYRLQNRGDRASRVVLGG